jgi:aminomethyltransferase
VAVVPGNAFGPGGVYVQLKTTPFHERTSACASRRTGASWAGYFAAGSYELTLDREYWAIRNCGGADRRSPLIKYIIEGKDAARCCTASPRATSTR